MKINDRRGKGDKEQFKRPSGAKLAVDMAKLVTVADHVNCFLVFDPEAVVIDGEAPDPAYGPGKVRVGMMPRDHARVSRWIQRMNTAVSEEMSRYLLSMGTLDGAQAQTAAKSGIAIQIFKGLLAHSPLVMIDDTQSDERMVLMLQAACIVSKSIAGDWASGAMPKFACVMPPEKVMAANELCHRLAHGMELQQDATPEELVN